MDSKETFLKEKELKLSEAANVLLMLRELVPVADDLQKAGYFKLLRDLEQESRSLRSELAELRVVSDDGWEDVRDRIEIAWSKRRTEIELVICDFEGETD